MGYYTDFTLSFKIFTDLSLVEVAYYGKRGYGLALVYCSRYLNFPVLAFSSNHMYRLKGTFALYPFLVTIRKNKYKAQKYA